MMTTVDLQTSTPAKPTRRERLRVMMRDDILAAARALVRAGGFTELTMRALAREVGVTPPTLYDYFLNKEAVLDALFAEGAARLHRSFQTAIAAHPPGLERLTAIAAEYRAFSRAEPDLFALIFARVDASYCPEESVKANAAALFDVLLGVVREAIETGDIKSADPELIGVSTWAAVHGFVMLESHGMLDDCSPREADAIFANHMQLLYDGLRP